MTEADQGPDEFRIAMGTRLRALRRAMGLSQAALSESSGLAADTIRRLERGEFSPTITTLRKLASALRTDLTGLFSSIERDPDDPERDGDLVALVRSLSADEMRAASEALTLAVRMLTARRE